jgi:C1A family cysteine protease
MKRILRGLFLVGFFAIASEFEQTVETLFSAFTEKYKKVYAESEYSYRLSVFKDNLSKLSSPESYTVGVTKFFDLTQEEFESRYLASRPRPDFVTEPRQIPNQPIPDGFFDLRAENLVTPVKDQGKCACSWAFAATGLIETAFATNTGKLQSFSEQQLLDCIIFMAILASSIRLT